MRQDRSYIRSATIVFSTSIILVLMAVLMVPDFSDAQGVRPDGPVATVKVARVKTGRLSEIVRVYGRTIPSPGRAKVLSIPYECRVNRVYVTQGQEVVEGAKLLEIGPSPETELRMEMAIGNLEFARLQLEKLKERASLKLATSAELIQAEHSFQVARMQVENLQNMGIAKKVTIFSQSDGVVSKLLVTLGTLVPAGTPLMEIVAMDAVQVVLGVEPEDAHLVSKGDKVIMWPVNREVGRPVTGSVVSVSRSINPSTRLLDVFVKPPLPSPFLLNEFIRAEIEVAVKEGLIVPRSAVLPKDGHLVIYTVENSRARRHEVSVGLENDGFVEICSGDIKADDLVVVLGNYELLDGMAVKVQGPVVEKVRQ